MIAVLPLLLYPLLGMSVFQLSQFLRKSEPKVLVIGSEQLSGERRTAAAVRGRPFCGQSCSTIRRRPIGCTWRLRRRGKSADNAAKPQAESGTIATSSCKLAEERLKAGDVQVVLNFPPDFGERLRELRTQIKARASGTNGRTPVKRRRRSRFPSRSCCTTRARRSRASPTCRSSTCWTRGSRRSCARICWPAGCRRTWPGRSSSKPHDVAERRQQQALMWSKILPFVLFIWALTGAFYPAVDLCAGEKERGTLETLLSSPALRSEIVWGKLLTVMTFSAATALLNLASLGFTARYVVSQLQHAADGGRSAKGLDLPPLASALWLVAALVPMSALFSALCLACAAFARSTKEGQYYLMPLLLVTHAADDAADGAGHGAEPGQQPHSDHGRRAAGDEPGARELCGGAAVRRAGVRGDARVLPVGDSLGRVSVQPGVGAVPRERAARPAAVDRAPGARSAGYAVAGGGVFLRRADLRDSVLHAARDLGQCAGDA